MNTIIREPLIWTGNNFAEIKAILKEKLLEEYSDLFRLAIITPQGILYINLEEQIPKKIILAED